MTHTAAPGTGDPTELVFMMGKFEARLPVDRRYFKNHMWAVPEEDGLLRVGLSAYAVRLLQDVYFLEWSIDPGTTVRSREAIGQIESSKAESELYSPAAGVIETLNETLFEDPSWINSDKYGRGWLFTLRGEPAEWLSPEEYLAHLGPSWDVAQKTIKGQIH